MAAASPTPEPAAASNPAPAQAAAAVTPGGERTPWWVPPWNVVLACGLYVLTFWLLYILAPERGKEPSELFKTLAAAVVLTAFVNGVVAAVFTANRDSQKKNDTIAAQARVIASQAPAASTSSNP